MTQDAGVEAETFACTQNTGTESHSGSFPHFRWHLRSSLSERVKVAVKGPFGAAVATLKRMQWTILEHDPYAGRAHRGPEKNVPAQHAQPAQKGGSRVAVVACRAARDTKVLAVELLFAPLLAALHSPRLSVQEQPYLRSTIVDGQRTQLRK